MKDFAKFRQTLIEIIKEHKYNEVLLVEGDNYLEKPLNLLRNFLIEEKLPHRLITDIYNASPSWVLGQIRSCKVIIFYSTFTNPKAIELKEIVLDSVNNKIFIECYEYEQIFKEDLGNENKCWGLQFPCEPENLTEVKFN